MKPCDTRVINDKKKRRVFELPNLQPSPGASIFDQPWSTLSGGEAQRVSLAIVIALQPDIMLLDVSMSALDELTALRVEATLKNLKTPIIMVSHSQLQVNRFCNRRVELTSPGGLSWSLLSSFE
jgi:ABC-type phosphate transport system ATPase subunit